MGPWECHSALPHRKMVFADEQVNMRSLGWVLIQYDWCFYKKGKFRHRHAHREKECHVKMKAEIRVMQKSRR